MAPAPCDTQHADSVMQFVIMKVNTGDEKIGGAVPAPPNPPSSFWTPLWRRRSRLNDDGGLGGAARSTQRFHGGDCGACPVLPSLGHFAASFPSITTALWFAGLIANDFR